MPRPVHHLAERLLHQRAFAVSALLVAMFAFFALTQPSFFTTANLQTLLTSAAILWVVAIGLTFVMLSGRIDLSLGSLVALCGIALGWLQNHAGLPAALACLAVLLLGALLGGAVNGLPIGWLGFPFLVVTLGSSILFRGVVSLWSHSRTEEVQSALLDWIAFGHLVGIPVPVLIMAVTLVAGLYVQRWTYFGRDIYALGSNPDAARLSGIRVVRTTVAVFAIAGLLAGLGSIIQVARIGAASPLVATDLIFAAAAAVLLGGTALQGGIGGVGGTAVGVLVLATLQNGLAVSGVASAWQQVATGAILLAALGVDRLSQRGRARRSRRPTTSRNDVGSERQAEAAALG